MNQHALSFNTRKALCLQLGDAAGKELADVLERLTARLDAMDREKVSVIPIVPGRTLGLMDDGVARAA
jgi:hypothetical protein